MCVENQIRTVSFVRQFGETKVARLEYKESGLYSRK